MTAVCPFDRRPVDQILVGTSEHRIDLKRSIPSSQAFPFDSLCLGWGRKPREDEMDVEANTRDEAEDEEENEESEESERKE